MDLLTYAVNRKLTQSKDPLLDYVAVGKDVPVAVLEDSLKELLRPLEDKQSSLLVEDYLEMLETYVPVQYTGNQPDGSYKVSGEISENLLEAINLVHGKGQEEVISEMVSVSTKQITNRSVKVGEISLTELTAQMESLTDNMSDIQGFEDEEGIEDEDFMDDDLVDEVVEGIEGDVEEEVEKSIPEETTDKSIPEETTEEEFIPEEDLSEESPKEPVEEEVSEEALDDTEKENLSDEEAFEEGEEVLEEMSEEEREAAESDMLRDGIKRVYSRLVEDLKAYGLDESLGLSL